MKPTSTSPTTPNCANSRASWVFCSSPVAPPPCCNKLLFQQSISSDARQRNGVAQTSPTKSLQPGLAWPPLSTGLSLADDACGSAGMSASTRLTALISADGSFLAAPLDGWKGMRSRTDARRRTCGRWHSAARLLQRLLRDVVDAGREALVLPPRRHGWALYPPDGVADLLNAANDRQPQEKLRWCTKGRMMVSYRRASNLRERPSTSMLPCAMAFCALSLDSKMMKAYDGPRRTLFSFRLT